MIKISLLFLLTLLNFSTIAQYDSKGENEVSRFRPGFMWFYTGIRPAKVEKVRKYDRLIFDVTYNDWVGDKQPFQNGVASIGLNTNLMFDIPLTKGNTISLGIGVSHQYTNIRHNSIIVISDSSNTSVITPMNATTPYQTRSLSGHSFSIPIEIRFRNESWRHFKVHLGGKIGYQANLFSKQRGNINGQRVKTKIFGFPDQNDWIYSAHVRIGLRNWALFASYNFNTIFSNKNSSQLNLIQMGLSISLF